MRATKVEIRRVARVWYQSRISAKSESRSGPDLRSGTLAAGATFGRPSLPLKLQLTAAGKALPDEDPQMCRVAMQKRFQLGCKKKRFRGAATRIQIFLTFALTGEKYLQPLGRSKGSI